MEHFWDLLLQLMKHGTNPLHVVFLYLFNIHHYTVQEFGGKRKMAHVVLCKCL